MKNKLLAIGIAVIASSLQQWPTQSTGKWAFPAGLLLAAISGVLAALLIRERFFIPVMSVAAGFAIADVVRILYDVPRDPTSHNLWPFEVVLIAIMGALGAIAGVGMVLLIRRFMGPARRAS